MSETPDSELLCQFLERRSQQAFAVVVGRYASVVYSAALRQTRNRDLAEKVSQRVFITLARKAARVRDTPALSAWLLTCTRYEALNLMRAEDRRRRHERKAAESRPDADRGPGHLTGGAADDRWADVAPMLDEAVETLGGRLREAVLLRYFLGKSVREVAERLGITEDAAKQRLSRGVEHLRTFFGRRGVVASGAALAVMLTAHAAEAAAPAGMLAAARAGSGMTAATAAAGWNGRLTFMATTAKIKGVAAAVGILAVLGAGTAVLTHTHHSADRELTVPLSGSASAAPWPSAPIGGQAGTAYRGVVRSADGRPVARAEVMLAGDFGIVRVNFQGGQSSPTARTDAGGRFEFPYQPGVKSIVVRCTPGYAEVPARSFTNGGDIVVQPWGRVEGVATTDGQPLAHRAVRLTTTVDGALDFGAMVDRDATATTDGEGRFTFPRVTPGRHWMGAEEQSRPVTSAPGVPVADQSVRVDVLPGDTTKVTIGGGGGIRVGRVVAGRIDGAQGLPLRGLLTPVPADVSTRPVTGEPGASDPDIPYAFRVVVGPDGSFRAADVPPGRYRLRLDAHVQPTGAVLAEHAAAAAAEFTVPADGGRAMDVGPFTAKLDRRLKIGDPAPSFAATTPDGRKVTLGDFAGRYLVLRISQAGRTPSWIDRPSDFDALLDRFGGGNVSFLTLDVAPTRAAPARTGTDPAVTPSWPHAAVGSPGELAEAYASAPVALFLIDPAGKVAAKWASTRSLWNVLETIPATRGAAGGGGGGIASVVTAHRDPQQADATYKFDRIPPIMRDDAGRQATFAVVDGSVSNYGGGGLARLNDGAGGKNVDDPAGAFFFDMGQLEGRLRADLGRAMPLDRVSTYSWHKSTRCPQVYRLYAADGTAPNFDPAPKAGSDPASGGWTLLASVDTRRPGDAGAIAGGQDAATVTGIRGDYRYLLFVTFVTETDDPFGHTFYDEIDVVGRE